MAKELTSGKLYDLLVEMCGLAGHDKKDIISIQSKNHTVSVPHGFRESTGAQLYVIRVKNPASPPEPVEQSFLQRVFDQTPRYENEITLDFSTGEVFEHLLNK